MGKLTKASLAKIPQTTGVYIFQGEKVAYVGKATNLRARVASHFENAKKDPREELILANSSKIKTIVTQSDFQALLLEADLIKKYKPKYNRAWKDDKSYLYIEITDEEYPKVLSIRGKDIDGEGAKKLFGPFASQRVVEELIHQARKVIPFCTRKRLSKIPCFHSKIGLCKPCPNLVASSKSRVARERLKKQYRKNIRQVISIFQGKAEPVLADLKKKMEQASKEEKFEEAVILRNRITRFEKLLSYALRIKEDYQSPPDTQGSIIKLLTQYLPTLKRVTRIEAYDISNLSQKEPTASMVVSIDGMIDKSQYRKFRIRDKISDIRYKRGDVGMLTQVLERRFKNNWPNPDLIIVDGGKPQVRITREALAKIGKKIPVIGIAKAPDRLIIGTGNLPTIRPQLSDPGFNLIRLLRDESHRFARRYHLVLRSKQFLPQSREAGEGS